MIGLLASVWAAEVLPVQRVRFYETGVAWFEREGVVTDGTELPVPVSHLDDALKSLVVLGSTVDLEAITFPSAIGDRAARAEAGMPDGGSMAFGESLRALLGVEVTARARDAVHRGVLVDVETLQTVHPTAAAVPANLATEYALTILAADGGIQRVATAELTSLTSDEHGVTERLGAVARSLSRTRAVRPHALDVQLVRGGRLGLGYLAEAPVWRVSYRILDPGEGTGQLQAWGLVHNTTSEDWEDVKIELANGEPDSFLFPLAQPRYADRELRTPEELLASVGQLATTTPDAMWDGSPAVAHGAGGLGVRGYGSGGGGYGSAGTGVGVGGAVALKTAPPVETPTQFVYRVARGVDLPARHSALVPLVQGGVPAERAVVFGPHGEAARNGLWLENGTEQTLPAGVVSVIDSGGLAGEAELERLKPEETQMLTFGNELDVELSRSTAQTDTPARLSRRGRKLVLESEREAVHTLSVRNRSGRERALWVAFALRPHQDLQDGVRTEIDPHLGYTYAVIDAPPARSERVLAVDWPVESTHDPAALPAETYREWATLGIAPGSVLRAAADARERIAHLDGEIQALGAESARVRSEVAGHRQTLQSAGGSDATGAVARRAATAEGELRKLSERHARLTAQRGEAVEALHEALDPLAPSVALAR